MLLTVGVNIICQTLQENVRSSELVTKDTTSHDDKKKSYIYVYFQLFCVHYHNRMNGSESLVCLTPSGVTRTSSVNKILPII